ncbi:MAG: HD-GYP domain-containing protein [Actinomycetota bacterium]|nr:HD-GYP domain-containing protein [Actinomycetota bacterium]
MSGSKGFPRRLAETLQAKDQRELAWETLDALVAAVNDHDSYTVGHSGRVARISADLARLLGSAPEQIAFVQQAALVHDVGKVSIPQALLKKRTPLTDEELHLVRLHPIMGASILSRMPGMDRFVTVVLHHHEHWDGSGYPSGLKEIEIPLESRIIAIADAFDAMTSNGAGGSELRTEDALAELRRSSGHQFDPLLVDAMHTAYRSGLLDNTPRSIVLPQSGWSLKL